MFLITFSVACSQELQFYINFRRKKRKCSVFDRIDFPKSLKVLSALHSVKVYIAHVELMPTYNNILC